jgi:PEGA domain
MSKEMARFGGRLLPIVVLIAVSPGCATVTGGAHDQNVKITSNPVGAAVLVDGQPSGSTPTTVKLCRKTEHHVEIAYPGCERAQVTIARHINPWLFGNIILGGPIGLVVDICTDATHNLSPDEVNVQLHAAKEPPKGYTASLK